MSTAVLPPPAPAAVAAPPATSTATPPPAPAPVAQVIPGAPSVLNDILSGIMDKKRKPAEKPEEPVKPVDPPAPAVATPEPAKKEEQAPDKKKRKFVIKPEDEPAPPQDIAAIAADAATKALEDRDRAKAAARAETVAAKEAKAKTDSLPKFIADRAAEYEQLEKLYPDVYGNGKLEEQLVETSRQYTAFVEEWKAANPGKKFKPEEHTDELEAMAPEIPEDHAITAKVRAVVEAEEKPRRIAQEKKDAEQKAIQVRQEAEQRLMSTAVEAKKRVGEAIIGIIDPELADIVKRDDKVAFKKFHEENEPLVAAYVQFENELANTAGRAAMIFSPGGAVTVDPSDPLDIEILSGNIMQSYVEANTGKRNDDGQVFAPILEYMKLSPSEQQKRWTVTKESFVEHIEEQAKERVSAYISRRQKEAEIFSKRFNASRKAQETPSATTVKAQEVPASKPSTPTHMSSPSAGATIVSAPKVPAANGNFVDTLFRRLTQ